MDTGDTQYIFSTRLALAAKDKGISQRDISRHFKVNPNTVNEWFKGRSFPGLNTVDELSTLLNVSPQWLFGANPVDKDRDQLIVKGISMLQDIGSIEALQTAVEALETILDADSQNSHGRQSKKA